MVEYTFNDRKPLLNHWGINQPGGHQHTPSSFSMPRHATGTLRSDMAMKTCSRPSLPRRKRDVHTISFQPGAVVDSDSARAMRRARIETTEGRQSWPWTGGEPHLSERIQYSSSDCMEWPGYCSQSTSRFSNKWSGPSQMNIAIMTSVSQLGVYQSTQLTPAPVVSMATWVQAP
jgi:hypothetical protein